MDKARLAVLILLFSSFADASKYPPLNERWGIDLGGDTLDVRDVNGDGIPDITMALFRDQSYVYFLDNQGVLQWRNKISVIWPQNTPLTAKVDILEGNNTDIIVGSVIAAKTCYGQLSPYENPLFVLERDPKVENNELKWVHRGYGYTISMEVADIDGDLKKEIITGTREGQVNAINPDGSPRWKYKTEGSVNAVYVTGLDNTKTTDIIAGSSESIHVLNSLGNKLWGYKTLTQPAGVYAQDLNRDGLKEVLVTDDNHTVYALTAGGDPIWNYSIKAIKPYIASGDLEGDGFSEVLVSSAQTLYALNRTGQLIWEYDVGYPITDLKTSYLYQNQSENVIVLGARRLTALAINHDFLKDKEAEKDLEYAGRYYENGTFEDARDFALKSAELYQQLNDSASASEALSINESSMLQIQAAAYLAEAEVDYAQGGFKSAKETAVEAEKIYIQLKDANATESALKIVNMAIDQLQAGELYNRALDYFHAKDYLQGSIYSRKALDIYLSINDTTWADKTAKILNNSEEYPKANLNYDDAMRQYQSQNYTAARDKAQSALKSYQLLGDEDMSETLRKMISNTEERIRVEETMAKAKESYTRSEQKANSANYHGCLDDVNKSIAYYQNVSDAAGEEKASKLQKRCADGVEALRYFSRAEEYFTNTQYEPATDYAAKARQLYRSIDDADGALKSSDLILEIEAEQKDKAAQAKDQYPAITTPMVIAAAAALILLLAAIYLLAKRRAKKTKEPGKTEKEPVTDYTALLPQEKTTETKETPAPPAEPNQPHLDDLLGAAKPPEAPLQLEIPTIESTFSNSLDDILAKASSNIPPEQKPPQTPKPEENRPEALILPDLDKPPETPKPPEKKEEPPQEPNAQEELKTAEKIKKELSEINKKLTRK